MVMCKAAGDEPYKELGCWGDKWAPRAISGKAIKVSHTPDGIKQCADYAKSQGFTVFALQYTEWCFTSADAEQTYKKYGERSNCHNGRGGTFANSVYSLKDTPKEENTCQLISTIAYK